MRMIHRPLIPICVFLLVWMPAVAHAQSSPEVDIEESMISLSLGKISQLRKGQRAPFAGVLFSDDAAARLYSDIKFSEEECQLRLSRELQINTLQLTSQIEALTLRLSVETERTTKLLSIRDERIEFLESNFTPPAWYESGEFWFAIGVISGIAITAVSAYALRQTAQ